MCVQDKVGWLLDVKAPKFTLEDIINLHYETVFPNNILLNFLSLSLSI